MFRYPCFLAMFVGVLVGTGCGGRHVPVSGVVTIDGKPVEGATVTFITEDGKQSASGQTDASGNFTLSESGKSGVQPGSYKVIVTKTKGAAAPGEEADPADMAKAMKKFSEQDAKAGAAKTGSKPGGSDMMSKMKMTAPGGGTGGSPPEVKSQLPAIYASSSTTPITVKVPPDSQPVKIELKSKP